VVGPTSLFPRCFFWNFAYWYSKREFGFTCGRVATRDSCAMLRRAKRPLIPPTHRRVEVVGVAAQWESWRLPRGGSRGG
jgi:hypothetical protein